LRVAPPWAPPLAPNLTNYTVGCAPLVSRSASLASLSARSLYINVAYSAIIAGLRSVMG